MGGDQNRGWQEFHITVVTVSPACVVAESLLNIDSRAPLVALNLQPMHKSEGTVNATVSGMVCCRHETNCLKLTAPQLGFRARK